MSQIANIDRTASDVSALVHENFVNEIVPWLDHASPMSGLFETIGDKGFDLVGESLKIGARYTRSGGAIGTGGYLPDSEFVQPAELTFSPARVYVRRAMDNFIAAIAKKPGAYAEYVDELMDQMWDAFDLTTTRHIHGGSAATVCTFVSRTSATVLVVDNGYGYAGANPGMYIEAGMTLALLDASASYATIGAAVVSSVDYDTSETTATITFATDIDTSSTGADGDPLVFATTADESATRFETERAKAPLGLLDIIDPADSLTTYAGLTESSYDRINPTRVASTSFGQVEVMEFLKEIGARSNSQVTAESHVLTCQGAVEIELAKELLAFQQQQNLGRTLQGGWETVKVGRHDLLVDDHHLPDVLYAIAPEDMFVATLGGEAKIFSGDGSQFSRLADYDGVELFASWYGQRGALRRNRCGALTGISVSNKSRFAAVPVA